MPIFFFLNNHTDVPMKFAIILSRRRAAMIFPITLPEFIPVLFPGQATRKKWEIAFLNTSYEENTINSIFIDTTPPD